MDRVEASWGEDSRITIICNNRSFSVGESEHLLGSFLILSKKTTVSCVAKTVKDTINNRMNQLNGSVRSMPFITVSDLEKVDRLLRGIAAANSKGKHKIAGKVVAGINVFGRDSDRERWQPPICRYNNGSRLIK